MLQSCFLQIAISQDWVNGFWISQSLCVKEALEHILNLSRLHNSWKQMFCVTKCPKTVLFYQFHSWVIVCFDCSFMTVLRLLPKGKGMRLINLLGTITMMSILVDGLILTPAKFVKDFAKTNQLNNVIIHSVQKNPTPFTIEWWVKCFCLNKIFN